MKIAILPLQPEDLMCAVNVLGKAFATQPSTIYIYRGTPDIERRTGLNFRLMFESMPGELFAAKRDEEIVGAMRIVQWPDCQMKLSQGVKLLPALIRSGGMGSLLRAMKFRGRWANKDPKKPHWHLDPLGVLPDLQGKGVGSAMMEYYCRRVEEESMAAYLETDRPENVPFYEKFGYEVIGEEEALGFKSWFMWREPINRK